MSSLIKVFLNLRINRRHITEPVLLVVVKRKEREIDILRQKISRATSTALLILGGKIRKTFR